MDLQLVWHILRKEMILSLHWQVFVDVDVDVIMKLQEIQIGRKEGPSIIPIVIGALIFPLSTVLWIVNFFFPIVTTSNASGMSTLWIQKTLPRLSFNVPSYAEYVTPGRWFLSFLIPIFISFYGYRKKSLSLSGALAGKDKDGSLCHGR